MAQCFRWQILTLVLMSGVQAMAAPATNYTPGDTDDQTVEAKDPRNIEDENLLIKDPVQEKHPSRASSPSYYPYKQSITARIFSGNSSDSENSTVYGAGISFQWPRAASPYAELGADVVTDVGGHAHFGVKHVYYERRLFRPYFIWGLSHELIGEEKLATFTNIDNYYARLSAGFEWTLRLPRSWRFEIQALAGMEKTSFTGVIGHTWGW